jgi:hypothetical protein
LGKKKEGNLSRRPLLFFRLPEPQPQLPRFDVFKGTEVLLVAVLPVDVVVLFCSVPPFPVELDNLPMEHTMLPKVFCHFIS